MKEKANDLQAQFLKQSKKVEEAEIMERQAFKLELKSESEALEAQSNARNNGLQCDQDNKLKALLARHARELLDHSTETEKKIREAKDEASKAKNDQQRCHKQREAELEQKFQEKATIEKQGGRSGRSSCTNCSRSGQEASYINNRSRRNALAIKRSAC
jgi:hypothetical protein